jgi:hypothetical protein
LNLPTPPCTLTRMAQRTESLINGLVAEFYPDGVLISGRTFDNKDAIKALGASWSPPLKKWKLPLDVDLSSLRPQVREQPPPQPRAQVQPRVNLYANRPRRRGACCSQCKTEFDQFRPDGPLWYVCPVHGKWQSDYTGD